MKKESGFLICLLATLIVAPAHGGSHGEALVFYAPFDKSADAEVGGGDRKIYSAPKIAFPPAGSAGLPTNKFVTLEPAGGVQGGYLRFHKKVPDMVFFFAKGNMPYATNGWSGAVSFWLRLTPDEDLEPGYTDPIQITSKGWDNAAFFVEFTRDEKPREFRLGVYSDHNVWNPQKRDWNTIPMAEKPLVRVIRPPFSRQTWTHVVFTFEKFNTNEPTGVAKLYLNGELQGALTPRMQTFTWDLDKSLIMPGLSYIGDFDEFAIFNRTLLPDEVASIYSRKSVRPSGAK
jgi:hypothetical protein